MVGEGRIELPSGVSEAPSLATSRLPGKLAGTKGFEPLTHAFKAHCSTGLSYVPMALGEGVEPSSAGLESAVLPLNDPSV